MPKLVCKADECEGELDLSILTKTKKTVYVCKKCKRAYSPNGFQIFSFGVHELFFQNGEFVTKDKFIQ